MNRWEYEQLFPNLEDHQLVLKKVLTEFENTWEERTERVNVAKRHIDLIGESVEMV